MEEAKHRRQLQQPDPILQIRACDLPNGLLPTFGYVIGRVLKVRMEEMHERKVTENSVSIKSCIATVAKAVAQPGGGEG